MTASSTASRFTLRGIALAYLGVVLLLPVGLILWQANGEGWGNLLDAMTTPEALAAMKLTLISVAIAVPLNTIFGVGCALLLVRKDFRGKGLLNAVIDLPFALSPVVIGLALLLVYGNEGWFGSWLVENGIQIVASTPGIVMACMFVSLPFVVREVMPVLREVGTEQEEAASTLGAGFWQTFWRVTLPSIRWGVGYGVVLTTARVLGEFGAVSVISGSLAENRTLPLYVEAAFRNFDTAGFLGATIVLAVIAFIALFAMNLVGGRTGEAKRGAVVPVGREAIDPKETA